MMDFEIDTVEDEYNLDIYETNHYKIYKDGLKLIGLWPFESATKKALKRAMVLVCMTSALSLMIVRFMEELNQNIDIVLQIAGSVILSIGCIAKFITTLRAENAFKLLFIRIAKQWANITEEIERKILADNVADIHPLCTFYRVMSGIVLATYACLPSFGPIILNIFLPLNETRRKQLPAPAEYFVDEEKYFYIIFLHAMSCYILVPILYVNIDSMYACIVQHTVGLVGIITYRLQNVINVEDTSFQQRYKNNSEIKFRIRRAITLHKEFIQFRHLFTSNDFYSSPGTGFAEMIETTYSLCFIIVMFVNLFAMVFTAACAIRIIHMDLSESIRWFMLYGGICFHLFFNSNPGQNLFDKSNELINTLYFTDWYAFGVSTSNKKTIQIMMIRCSQPCQLTAGGLLILNIENFGVILKTSFSYITMLISLG